MKEQQKGRHGENAGFLLDEWSVLWYNFLSAEIK